MGKNASMSWWTLGISRSGIWMIQPGRKNGKQRSTTGVTRIKNLWTKHTFPFQCAFSCNLKITFFSVLITPCLTFPFSIILSFLPRVLVTNIFNEKIFPYCITLWRKQIQVFFLPFKTKYRATKIFPSFYSSHVFHYQLTSHWLSSYVKSSLYIWYALWVNILSYN